MQKLSTQNPTGCRLWIDQRGLLHILDLDRNIEYDVYPMNYQRVDSYGIPEVLKTFSDKLPQRGLERLLWFLDRKNLVPWYNCLATDLFITSCMN